MQAGMCQWREIEIGCKARRSRGWGRAKGRVVPVTRQGFRIFAFRFGCNFDPPTTPEGLTMASTLPANSFNATRWRHLLRATLRECTYLPDPIARHYMHHEILARYRAAASPGRSQPAHLLSRKAKSKLSLLKRANAGHPSPLEKVLLTSYGRVGKRRHQLLAQMMTPPIPEDTQALRGLVEQPNRFDDGWQAPSIMMSLAKSQINNGVLTASRVRPQVKSLFPRIPEENSWGSPVCRSRRVNIRRKWYQDTMYSLLPPLPEEDLRILDGLISGTVKWEPVPRRKPGQTTVQDTAPIKRDLLGLLVQGPQKEGTFGAFVDGRPHRIRSRYMRRHWRRVSSLVPRMRWDADYEKWRFSWETPKTVPRLAFQVNPIVDSTHLFQDQTPKTTVSSQSRSQTHEPSSNLL
ncbi:hypothetical protein NUU61_002379 [Penicillium alfredii]|uniref:LYR motif-containing protein Cup1-like N-terminal domain-containing protein n=1 Tax=Penicillium alfredii TaxID=1506179 RepID=A0A9W9KH91_9EURO|nr:uncharacterized protein NUU61_002379 [Penicillium alfredii]KAJ5105032.1 hypothetical protein NUU61_002379 [Penicillium alfredii]